MFWKNDRARTTRFGSTYEGLKHVYLWTIDGADIRFGSTYEGLKQGLRVNRKPLQPVLAVPMRA